MLGGRIGSRAGAGRIGRDRAVVDDPPALRRLRAHDPERLPRDVERAVEVYVDHALPGRDIGVAEAGLWRKAAGIVEHHIHATQLRLEIGEVAMHRCRIGNVADATIAGAAESGRLRQFRLTPPQNRHSITGFPQPDRRRPTNSRGRAGHHRHLAVCHFLLSRPSLPSYGRGLAA